VLLLPADLIVYFIFPNFQNKSNHTSVKGTYSFVICIALIVVLMFAITFVSTLIVESTEFFDDRYFGYIILGFGCMYPMMQFCVRESMDTKNDYSHIIYIN